MHLKTFFINFCWFLHIFPKQIFASNSTAIFSVICCARQVFFYYFHKIQTKIFQNIVLDGAQFFWKGQKPHSKIVFADFYTFYQLYLTFWRPIELKFKTQANYFPIIWLGHILTKDLNYFKNFILDMRLLRNIFCTDFLE